MEQAVKTWIMMSLMGYTSHLSTKRYIPLFEAKKKKRVILPCVHFFLQNLYMVMYRKFRNGPIFKHFLSFIPLFEIWKLAGMWAVTKWDFNKPTGQPLIIEIQQEKKCNLDYIYDIKSLESNHKLILGVLTSESSASMRYPLLSTLLPQENSTLLYFLTLLSLKNYFHISVIIYIMFRFIS